MFRYCVILWILGTTVAFGQPTLDEVIDAHYANAVKWRTLRFSGTVIEERFDVSVSQAVLDQEIVELAESIRRTRSRYAEAKAVWEKEQAERPKSLRRDGTLSLDTFSYDDKTVTQEARAIVNAGHSDRRDAYQLKVLYRNENEKVEKYIWPQSLKMRGHRYSKLNVSQQKRAIYGKDNHLAWNHIIQEMPVPMNEPMRGESVLHMGTDFLPRVRDVCNLGTMRWARLGQADMLQTYKKFAQTNKMLIGQSESGEIVLSSKRFKVAFDPLHGYLLTESFMRTKTKQGVEFILEKNLYSNFAQSNGVWYAKKVIRERRAYCDLLAKSMVTERITLNVEVMEINGKITDEDLDYLVPGDTWIVASDNSPSTISLSAYLPHRIEEPTRISEIECCVVESSVE